MHLNAFGKTRIALPAMIWTRKGEYVEANDFVDTIVEFDEVHMEDVDGALYASKSMSPGEFYRLRVILAKDQYFAALGYVKSGRVWSAKLSGSKYDKVGHFRFVNVHEYTEETALEIMVDVASLFGGNVVHHAEEIR